MDAGAIVGLVIAVMGLGGLVFTAMRYRRDDTTAIVTQQDTLFNELRAVNDELRIENARLKAQVQELQRGDTSDRS